VTAKSSSQRFCKRFASAPASPAKTHSDPPQNSDQNAAKF
jgi:hypothetical protein